MVAPGRFDHLRRSALDLLDAGNSPAAVAQVLAVPVSVLTRWRDGPVPPAPQPQDLAAALVARGEPIHFRTSLLVAPTLLFRLGHLGYALYVAFVAVAAIADYLREGAHSWTEHAGLSVLAVLGLGIALAWWRSSQVSLVLGPGAMSVPTLFGRRSLAYSDLADYWLVLHVRHEGTDDEIEGRLLTLHSRRAGVRPLEVFISDRDALDPRVIERLDQVKSANRGVGPLTPMQSIPKA